MKTSVVSPALVTKAIEGAVLAVAGSTSQIAQNLLRDAIAMRATKPANAFKFALTAWVQECMLIDPAFQAVISQVGAFDPRQLVAVAGKPSSLLVESF